MRISQKFRLITVLIFLLFFSLPSAWANNLTITNVSLETRNQASNTAVVEFDLDWGNSWRDATNWDAAWIFLKVSVNSGNWVHGKMAASGTNPAGTSDGTGTTMTINVPSDRIGAFIYRTSNGTGSISNNNVRLVLDYGSSPVSAGDDDLIQVRVYGLEMVYIPTGDFWTGDGSYTDAEFFDAGTSDRSGRIQITSSTVYVSEYDDGSGTSGDLAWCSGGFAANQPGSRTSLANFPTGYSAFYVMKYEISQGQYRDFLNTLTSAQYGNRVLATTNNYYAMSNTTSPSHRQTIKYKSSGTPFVCDLNDNDTGDEASDGEWIAMNYIIWQDVCAFNDWAGLRPLNDLEFEKICWGTGSASGLAVYVWGTYSKSCTISTPISNAGTSSEVPSSLSGDGCQNQDITDGPLRVGFAATASSDREGAAAGYYGVMNLGANLRDQMVTLDGDGLIFRGSHGDGTLTTTSGYEGNATNTDWPGINATTSRGVTGYRGSGCRTGACFDTGSENRLFNRGYTGYEIYTRGTGAGGAHRAGGRGVRDAP